MGPDLRLLDGYHVAELAGLHVNPVYSNAIHARLDLRVQDLLNPFLRDFGVSNTIIDL
ncbi:hypothetical protein ACVWW6_000229 [Bradyrhizobium sp. USDA 3311]